MRIRLRVVSGLALLSLLTCNVMLNPTLTLARDRLDGFSWLAAKGHDVHLRAMLDEAVRDGLPGISLVLNGAGFDFRAAVGVSNLVTREPLTPDHLMYVASVGKVFTAVVALQLCEERKLDLEAPISTWLPAELTKRIPSSDKITLRHLLAHTSGIFDYMNDDAIWRNDFSEDPRREWSHDDIITYFYDKPLLFQPGTDYHYSNSNYILVGRIIEQVSGQPLHQQIRQRILSPLDLRSTFNGAEAIRDQKHAHGYFNRHGHIIDTFPWYSHYGLADSGIHSTPADLAVFIQSLFTGERILSERMRVVMTDVSAPWQLGDEYGMGIYVQRNPWGAGLRWYTHDGIDPGYQADIMYLPDYDLVVVVAANASLGLANVIYEKLITAVIQLALDAILNPLEYDQYSE